MDRAARMNEVEPLNRGPPTARDSLTNSRFLSPLEFIEWGGGGSNSGIHQRLSESNEMILCRSIARQNIDPKLPLILSL